MLKLTLTGADLPFLLGGAGALDVRADVPDPLGPIPPGDVDLFTLGFAGDGSNPFSFGANDTVRVGIRAGADSRLLALWPTSAPERLATLDGFGLAGYLADHPDELLLVFTAGANAGADLAASFNYSALSAGVTLDTSVDAAYTLIRPEAADRPAGEALRSFFENLRLPANVAAPLAEGETIVLEYGGSLELGASVGAGYRLSGTKSFEIGGLDFAESYTLGALGQLALTSRVAGRFRIEARRGSEPSRVHVVVRKSAAKAFAIAADVTASADLSSSSLPDTPDDLVSAIFGLRANTWLNLFDQARDFSDLAALRERLDTLAESFVERFVGKAFDEIANKTQFDELVARLVSVADAYRSVDERVIALFDRYFDPQTKRVSDALEHALDTIKNATSLDRFRGQVDPVLWDVLTQLTGGDPLDALLGQTGGALPFLLDDLKARADGAIDALREAAHNGILRVIDLARTEFHLDSLAGRLDGLDWQALEARADRTLLGFVERLTGEAFARLDDSGAAKVVARFHQIMASVDDFTTTAYDRFKEAINRSYQFQLHAAYSRATEHDALVECEIDVTTAEGRELMRAAGQGDFSRLLGDVASPALRILGGELTRRLTKQSELTINVLGWRDGWRYSSLERVVTDSRQHIMADDNGLVTITTTLELDVEREENRNGERVYTNLLLRFLGDSRGAVELDARHQSFLVDAITHIGAQYRLVFEDPDTDRDELRRYLSVARAFGLTQSDDGAFDALAPTLPADARGHFGSVTITYEARFTEEGLGALFHHAITVQDAARIREEIRRIVLADYVNRGAHLANRAWVYVTPEVRAAWKQLGPGFMNVTTGRKFSITSTSPIPSLVPPKTVTLPRSELFHLNTLFSIEDSLVTGLIKLTNLVRAAGAGVKLAPAEFQQELSDFGSALNNYQTLGEGANSIFALFDFLVRTSAPASGHRAASLTLEATLDTTTVTKMLIA